MLRNYNKKTAFSRRTLQSICNISHYIKYSKYQQNIHHNCTLTEIYLPILLHKILCLLCQMCIVRFDIIFFHQSWSNRHY